MGAFQQMVSEFARHMKVVEAALPKALTAAMVDTQAPTHIRSAALTALLELTLAVHFAAEVEDGGFGGRLADQLVCSA